MTDEADHITGLTGLSPTVTISKNAAAFGAPSGAVTEISSGWYKVAGNATDSNTLGEIALHATATGADPFDGIVGNVVAYDPDDAVRGGLTALPNANAEAAGGLYTRGTGAGQINQPANGQVDANTVKVSGTVQTARDLGTSVLLSSGTGTGQVLLSSGLVGLSSTAISNIWSFVVVGSKTVVQLLRGFAAVLLGKVSGGGTATIKFRDTEDTKDVVTCTEDISGNRTAVTLDLT